MAEIDPLADLNIVRHQMTGTGVCVAAYTSSCALVGYVKMLPHPLKDGDWVVNYWEVIESYRGTGVGSALYLEAQRLCGGNLWHGDNLSEMAYQTAKRLAARGLAPDPDSTPLGPSPLEDWAPFGQPIRVRSGAGPAAVGGL